MSQNSQAFRLFDSGVTAPADLSLERKVLIFLKKVFHALPCKGVLLWQFYEDLDRPQVKPSRVYQQPETLSAIPGYQTLMCKLDVQGGPGALMSRREGSFFRLATDDEVGYLWRVPDFGVLFLIPHASAETALTDAEWSALRRMLAHFTREARIELLERQVTKERQRLGLAAATAELGQWEVVPETGEVVWDERMLQIYGIRGVDFRPQLEFWLQRLHAEDRAEFHKKLVRGSQQGGHFQAEFRIRHGDGSIRYQTVRVHAVSVLPDAPVRLLGVSSDSTQIRAHEAELYRIAYYDPLTHLPNRQLLMDRLRQAWSRSRRNQSFLAICYLDLDEFKNVNDNFGHSAGDRVLMEMARRIESVIRGADTAARVGGDEFVLLLSDLVDDSGFLVVIERILAEVQRPVVLDDRLVAVPGSIGVTVFPVDDADPDTLLRHADQAMYTAKSLGRNRYFIFDLGSERAAEERRVACNCIELGVTQREFQLFYQPKVDLLTGAVIGMEGLIRWNHPEQGLLTPDAFLPIIQNTALENVIGKYVLESALEQLTDWIQNDRIIPVSINISADHLLSDGFIEQVCSALERFATVRGEYLEFEILESAAVGDMERAVQTLRQCHDWGIQLSLDDFGTGYSSLNYFRRLPIDTLKIDRGFVRDMLSDKNDRGIVESVVRLANTFGRRVIAEGVETLDHASALLSVGCTLAQGYGIGRPMPASDVDEWLQRWFEQRFWEKVWPQTVGNKEPLQIYDGSRSEGRESFQKSNRHNLRSR